MSNDDLIFYQRRFQQETRLEQTAASAEAASAHRTLALIYAAEVRRLTPPPPLRIVGSFHAEATIVMQEQNI